MDRSYIVGAVLALTLGAVGCHTGARKAVCADPCPADGCAPGAEDIVVHAPPQKVIVKTPAPCPPEVAATPQGLSPGAPPSAAAAPQGTFVVPQGFVGVPQGVGGFGAQPLAMGAPFGAAGGNTSTTVTTNQRTRVALSFTTIKIPLPWFKLIPVTEPTETTIRITGQAAQSQGFGVPMGVMPAAAFGAGSLPGAPGSFVQGQFVGPPVAQGVAGAQALAAPAAVCPPCPPADPNAVTITPERLRALTKKIEELEAAKKAQEEGKK